MAILAGTEVRGEGEPLCGVPFPYCTPFGCAGAIYLVLGVAYKSSAPPVLPPVGGCELFGFVILLLSWELKKRERIVDEGTVVKISFLLAASILIKRSVPWLCLACQPL